MRIAFVNHSRRKVGGAEVYLDAVIPAFARAGHEIACLFEDDPGSPHDAISIPDSAPQWCVSRMTPDRTLAAIREWKPDVCFTHGLHDPHLEAGIVALRCGALFVHSYYGMCISGDKTTGTMSQKPCQRRFGAACLLHYFPDHCGGRNPVTMVSRYRLQSRRLHLMREYRGLIANSSYVAQELSRHGLSSECVYPFTGNSTALVSSTDLTSNPLRLIFAGRMHSLKGGHLLLQALPQIQHRLDRQLHITFAGDGPERSAWQANAAGIVSDRLSIEFTGWLSAGDLTQRLCESHLLVMPSVWPEPFGLSGLEAGLLGVPTAAFAVGGIPEWLHEGVNGHLASAPAHSTSLVEAIVRCLNDPGHYQQLRSGARSCASNYSLETHLSQLLRIFARCAA